MYAEILEAPVSWAESLILRQSGLDLPLRTPDMNGRESWPVLRIRSGCGSSTVPLETRAVWVSRPEGRTESGHLGANQELENVSLTDEILRE